MRDRHLARRLLTVLALSLVFGLVACAHQPTPASYDPPGFLYGILHGYLIFFSAIGSIFLDVRIYAFPNSGFWYDIGYAIGAFSAVFSIFVVLS